MAGGTWLAFQPILNRETVRIVYLGSPEERVPTRDALLSGARFALDEAGWRAGPYRVEFDTPASMGSRLYEVLLTVDPQRLLQAEFQHEPWSSSDTRPDAALTLQAMGYLSAEGRAAAAWAKDTGSLNTAIVYDQAESFSGMIALDFRSQADFLHVPYGPLLDMAAGPDMLIDRLLEAKPDLVFYAGERAPYSTGFDLFNALRAKGYKGRLAMADADPEVSFLAVSDHVVEGTYLISTIGPPSKEFSAAYEPATGRHAGPHAWPGYRLMKRVLDVIGRSPSPRSIDLIHQANLLQEELLPCSLYILRGGKFVFVQDLK